jgi:integrase
MAKDLEQNGKAGLHKEVTGYWAQQVWCNDSIPLGDPSTVRVRFYYRFQTYSDGVNLELKYALKQLFTQKQWKTDNSDVQHVLHTFIKCFNETTQDIDTLMLKPLSFWEKKLTAYLKNKGLVVEKTYQYYCKKGEKKSYTLDHAIIGGFRRIWFVVVDYYDTKDEWDKDVIDARRVGLFISPGSCGYRLNLSTLTPPWFKEATRQCLRYHANRAYGSLAGFLTAQKRFSHYLALRFPNLQPEQLDRPLIVEFIKMLNKHFTSGTVAYAIGNLKLFLETCANHGFASVPNKTLIFKEDFPKRARPNPKFIPDEVLQQIFAHLDQLPEPYRLLVLILEQTGCRVGEALGLTLDCLSTDAEGDYFLKRWVNKQKKFHNVPIKKELAVLIRNRVRYIFEEGGEQAHYLFPNRQGGTLQRSTFFNAFTKWAIECDIRDKSGQLYVPHFHQFRHTIATRLLNNGMSQYMVKQFLGHESPDMTAVYAHLLDDTAKQALNTFLTQQDNQLQSTPLIDASGKVVNLDDLWLKQNLKAQALPNGICALPVMLGECPHANACLDCQHFCTSRAYLPVHQKQLALSEQAQAKALDAGKTLQVELASKTCAKLRTLINQLETNNVNTTETSRPRTDHPERSERD